MADISKQQETTKNNDSKARSKRSPQKWNRVKLEDLKLEVLQNASAFDKEWEEVLVNFPSYIERQKDQEKSLEKLSQNADSNENFTSPEKTFLNKYAVPDYGDGVLVMGLESGSYKRTILPKDIVDEMLRFTFFPEHKEVPLKRALLYHQKNETLEYDKVHSLCFHICTSPLYSTWAPLVCDFSVFQCATKLSSYLECRNKESVLEPSGQEWKKILSYKKKIIQQPYLMTWITNATYQPDTCYFESAQRKVDYWRVLNFLSLLHFCGESGMDYAKIAKNFLIFENRTRLLSLFFGVDFVRSVDKMCSESKGISSAGSMVCQKLELVFFDYEKTDTESRKFHEWCNNFAKSSVNKRSLAVNFRIRKNLPLSPFLILKEVTATWLNQIEIGYLFKRSSAFHLIYNNMGLFGISTYKVYYSRMLKAICKDYFDFYINTYIRSVHYCADVIPDKSKEWFVSQVTENTFGNSKSLIHCKGGMKYPLSEIQRKGRNPQKATTERLHLDGATLFRIACDGLSLDEQLELCYEHLLSRPYKKQKNAIITLFVELKNRLLSEEIELGNIESSQKRIAPYSPIKFSDLFRCWPIPDLLLMKADYGGDNSATPPFEPNYSREALEYLKYLGML